MNEKILAVIPARANSKGVKNKNIKRLVNKPLISHTIDFVKRLKFVNKIIVSSDSLKIKKISEKKKVEFFLRPKSLATDKSKIDKTLLDILKKKSLDKNFKYLLLFEPTSPFRKIQTIKECVKILKKPEITSVFTVSKTDKLLGEIKKKKFRIVINNVRRRQDRKDIFFECGSVYGLKIEDFIQNKKIIDENSYPLEINEIEAIDINSDFDFLVASCLFKFLKSKSV